MNNINNNKSLTEFLKGFLGIFTYLFINLSAVSVFYAFGINVTNLSRKSKTIILLIISFIILAILIALSFKKLKINLKDYKKNWKELLKRNVKYWVCGLIIMAFFNTAIALIFNSITSANDQSIREMFEQIPIYIVLESAIIAPITEELVFRQSIRYMFKNKYIFIILSGLIFGFMHVLSSMETLADILYIIPYSVPGCFFAYMLYKEDNVLVPITFHMIHNSLALILLIISKLTGIM